MFSTPGNSTGLERLFEDVGLVILARRFPLDMNQQLACKGPSSHAAGTTQLLTLLSQTGWEGAQKNTDSHATEEQKSPEQKSRNYKVISWR